MSANKRTRAKRVKAWAVVDSAGKLISDAGILLFAGTKKSAHYHAGYYALSRVVPVVILVPEAKR